MMKNIFGEKRQYKGNLHTHTTRSDGKLELWECVNAYKERGYDFLCVTDHRVYFEGAQREDFLILSGEEFMFHDNERKTAYHIVGIDFDGHFETCAETLPQDVADGIIERGGIAVMGHPAWSLMSHDEILKVKGISALEVYSGISEEYTARGDSTSYADVLATLGAKYGLLGVDDMHFYKRDMCRAFTVLEADSLSRKSVREALDAKRYYASEGPLIKRLSADGNRVEIETSPLSRICFMSDRWYEKNRVHYSEKGDLTFAEYELKQGDGWLRIEGMDARGRKFTTNFLNTDGEGNII